MTGVTIMKMDAGMDTGPMLNVRTMPIGEDDTSETMFPKLSALGAEALTEALGMLRLGTLAGTPQDGAMATYAPMLKKEHGRIDWGEPAREGVAGGREGDRLSPEGTRPLGPWAAFTTGSSSSRRSSGCRAWSGRTCGTGRSSP